MTRSNAHTHHDFHSAFEEHFQAAFTPRGDYASYEPYYNLGHEFALDDGNEDRGYDEVEAELRAEFGRRYANVNYDHFEEAIRYGYDHTREILF